MRRCPVCSAEYPVSQGFCPMDGAALGDDDGAEAPLSIPDLVVATVSAEETTTGRAIPNAPSSPPFEQLQDTMPVPPKSTIFGKGVPPSTPSSTRARNALLGVAPSAVRAPAPAFFGPTKQPSGPQRGASQLDGQRSASPAGGVERPESGAQATSEDTARGAVAFFPPGGIAKRPGSEPNKVEPELPEEALIGKVLDQRYRIDAKIGAGGMGVVYRATHVIIDKPLAIKVLRSEHASQPEVVKRFLLEAQLASQIKHPNVVDISDYGQVPGSKLAYYVMEYLSGSTLAYRIDHGGGPLEPRAAIDVAIQAAGALGAAHGRGIIHRDLKPDNIFLTVAPDARGTLVKILDFGIARAQHRKTRLTASGVIVGTPAYMSPEQARGIEVDGRSDLYTLGVILFEMLTGKVPFRAKNTMQALSLHMFEEPPPLASVNPAVAELHHIERLIHQLLAKDREQRPQSAALLIKLLAHARDRDLGDTITTSRKGRRDTASLGSWSVGESGPLAAAESPPAPRIAEERPYKPGEIDTGPRAVLPEDAAAVVRPRSFGVSDRFKRKRPSVIVRHGQDVQRIAPRRSPIPEVPKSPLPGPVAQESVAASRGSRRVLVLVILAAVVGAAATLGIVRALQAGPTPTTEATPPAPAPVEPAAIEPAAIEPAVRPRIVLYFESDPPGAEVLDPAGEVIGVTPFKHAVERDPQQRVYTYRRAGYEIGSAKVSAQRTRKVHVALVELALEETAGTTGENALGATSEDAAQRRPSGGAQEDPSLDPTRPDATGRGATSEERGRDERRPGANLGELKDPFP